VIIDCAKLPTPLAKVGARLNVVGPDSTADTFLITSYLAESGIKCLAVGFYAALLDKAPDYAYRIGHDLVRADGLGAWEQIIRNVTTLPQASYLGPDFQSVLEWATRKRTKPEDAWYQEARAAASNVLLELGVEFPTSPRDSVRTLISALVQIRNKTKAHGAMGQDFFEAVNPFYIRGVTELLLHCPLFEWDWIDFNQRGKKAKIRGVLLRGISPSYLTDAEMTPFEPKNLGISYVTPQTKRLQYCGHLLHTNNECSSFFLPNGGFTAAGEAEVIDYGSGHTRKDNFPTYMRAPVPLPRSETHGLDTLDIQSNVFGNLPALPESYVRRPKLEKELEERLLDRNHAIVTLHGNGGVGKTYLALAGAHRIADPKDPRFDCIVWFSGRDVDLRPSGPISVKPSVLKLEDISEKYGSLFDKPTTLEYFTEVLGGAHDSTGKGILFVFDNFETMENVRAIHQFLDTYTHIPNKVLITSRERAFKADYPIEVKRRKL
jgi:hypothetical protein